MIKLLLNIISLLFLVSSSVSALETERNNLDSNSYINSENNSTLVYNSSFGESFTNYTEDGIFVISYSKSDKFKYRQTLIIKNDGVYVIEIYQYLKIFLFITKESTFTFEKPLLRYPLPLVAGTKWVWEGNEYSDGDTNKVKVNGTVFEKETIYTKAGEFEAMKVESIVVGSANVKNTVTEWYVNDLGLVKANIIVEGGGVMGLIRDILGYGTIEFEITEIRKHK